MTHAHTLRLVPADLDRLHAALARAGAVTDRPFEHPFELVAAIETAAGAVTRAHDRQAHAGRQGVDA